MIVVSFLYFMPYGEMRGYGGLAVQLHAFLTLSLDRGQCLAFCHTHFTCGTETLVPNTQEAGWKATSSSASHAISHILWNAGVHYSSQNSLPHVCIFSQINPVHVLPSYLFKIHFNIISHLCQGPPSGLFPSDFPTKTLYTFLLSPIHATCPTHLICPARPEPCSSTLPPFPQLPWLQSWVLNCTKCTLYQYDIMIWNTNMVIAHARAHTHTHTHTHHARTFVTRIHHLNGTYIKCLLIWHTVCWLTEQWLTVTLINQSINVFISVDLIYQIWKMS